MTNQQAPSDPLGEAFMSKMEKELHVKFVDATPKEAPSEPWEELARGVHYVGCDINDPNYPYGQCNCGAFADLRSMRAEAVEEAVKKAEREIYVDCMADLGDDTTCECCHNWENTVVGFIKSIDPK